MIMRDQACTQTTWVVSEAHLARTTTAVGTKIEASTLHGPWPRPHYDEPNMSRPREVTALGALFSSAGVDGEKRDGLRSGPSVWARPPASCRCLVQPPFFLRVDGNLKVWTAWPLRARTCHPSRNSNGVLPSPVWTIQPSREAQQASPSFGRKSPTNESKLHRHPSPVFVRVRCAADAPSPSWHRCEVPDPSGPLGRDPGTYHTTGATLPWSRPQSTTHVPSSARETPAPFFSRNIFSKPSKRDLRGITGRALVVIHAGNKGDMSCRRTSLAAITLRPTCGASGGISSSIPENLVERIHEAPFGNLLSTKDRLQSLPEK
ncbi:hypothetical protein CSOJ01_09550 [Colletotrichum sojae]|uniref:Uncharacterized protein n=1 Tax=Colletotrichum sojae TaxID=2175907 RepID=A0A8H6J2L5_9PEZI|nr:hypothetical protein CSOJ01_09550 [Colletotrichum sojae]